ncbi:MAG: hypothetical protein F6K10_13545 [Moorea sp. SIO2B7]|nr:hypothetical protein [Moorena sp. SIO2B7]
MLNHCFLPIFAARGYKFLQEISPEDKQAKALLEEWNDLTIGRSLLF